MVIYIYMNITINIYIYICTHLYIFIYICIYILYYICTPTITVFIYIDIAWNWCYEEMRHAGELALCGDASGMSRARCWEEMRRTWNWPCEETHEACLMPALTVLLRGCVGRVSCSFWLLSLEMLGFRSRLHLKVEGDPTCLTQPCVAPSGERTSHFVGLWPCCFPAATVA